MIRNYRELRKLNFQRNNDLMKRANELNRTFLKEEIERAKKVKKCSISLVIKEIQIKTPIRFHLTHVGMATIKNKNNSKCL
jgi:hypothetical protein